MTIETAVQDLTLQCNTLFDLVKDLIAQYTESGHKQTFYVSPDGIGAGGTEDSPCKFQTALDRLSPATLNIIKLSAGEHIANNATIVNIPNLIIEPWNYNPTNKPIICSPGTTAGQASEACGGSPQPSVTCGAHEYKETPLTFVNCVNVLIENIEFKGTEAALKALNSTVLLSGEIKLSAWVPRDGLSSRALWLEGSKIFCSHNSHIRFSIYHSDYSTVTPISVISPVFAKDASTAFFQNQVTVFYNLQLAEEQYKLAAFQNRTLSQIFINTLTMTNMGTIADVRKGVFSVGKAKLTAGSQALYSLMEIENEGKGSLGGNGDGNNWPVQSDPEHVKVKGGKAIRCIQNSTATVSDGVRATFVKSELEVGESVLIAVQGSSRAFLYNVEFYNFEAPIVAGSASTVQAYSCAFEHSYEESIVFSSTELASINLNSITITGSYYPWVDMGGRIVTPNGVVHQ